MLERMLSNAGYEVRTAKDGFDALAQMRQGVPELMITDLNTPNMSGFELLSVVRRRFPRSRRHDRAFCR
jgi:CheY-like chemotaxis protein